MSSAVILPFAPKRSETTAIMERYHRAYGVSHATSAFSEAVSLGGIALAGLFWMCGLIAYQAIPRERSGFPLVTVCFVAAAAWVVLVTRVVSRAFRVQAQLLETAVDSAVTASPFLSNPQRMEVMALLRPPAASGWDCARVRGFALLEQHRRLGRAA